MVPGYLPTTYTTDVACLLLNKSILLLIKAINLDLKDTSLEGLKLFLIIISLDYFTYIVNFNREHI